MPRLALAVAALVLVAGATVVTAQPRPNPRMVTGIVVDATSGEPIADAVVAAGTGEPVVTGPDGNFTIRVTGRPQILVSAAGFADRTVVARNGTNDLRVELTLSDDTEIIELEGRAPDLGKPPTWTMTPDQVRTLPGAGNDVLKALQSMPGVARIPFGLGGLVIRGQSPRDTNVYLDGIEVPLAFHFFGLSSFYPSSALESLEVANGGYGVEHGRGQGGLVMLTSRAPRRDGWHGSGEVSVLDAQAHAEGPTGRTGAISVGVRRSYIDGILRAVLPPDERFLPRYYDSQVRWDAGDARERGALTLWLFTSNDRMAEDDTSFTQSFIRFGARYRRLIGKTTLSLTPWGGRDRLAFVEEPDPEYGDEGSEFSRTSWPVGLRGSIVRDTTWGHVATGLDVQGARFGRIAFNTEGEDDLPGVTEIGVDRWLADVGLWAEARYRVDGERTVLKPGLRLERYGASDQFVADPRLLVTHTLSPSLTVRESVGLYHQPPTAADTDPSLGNPALDAAYTLQTSAGVEAVLGGNLKLGSTVFFNRGWHQAVAIMPPPGSGFDMDDAPGDGLGAVMLELLEEQLGSFQFRGDVGELATFGVEMGARYQSGPFLGWASYTLTKARRTDDPARGEGWRPYQLDQLHNLSLVGSVLWGKWQLGARFRLVTGNPYTPTLSVDPEDGDEVVGGRLSRRLPDFIQLDLRADRSWKRDWGTLKLFIDIQHVTWPLRENVEDAEWNWDLERETYINGLPILPLIGLEYLTAK